MLDRTPERYFSNTPWLANSYTKLKVNTAALEKATKTTYGIVKPDNSTVTISNGELGVKTSGLTRIDTSGGVGVVYVQPSTSNDYVYGDNGKIRLKPQYMPKAQTYNKKTNRHKDNKNYPLSSVTMMNLFLVSS